MGFVWDEESKAGINFRRHGARMPEAIPVFDDPDAITITDDESDPNERRFVTLGMGAAAVCLLSSTPSATRISGLSARPAEPYEREEYETEI
jgi:uncharacterized protein